MQKVDTVIIKTKLFYNCVKIRLLPQFWYYSKCVYTIAATKVACCCSAYLSSCHRTASDANLLDDPLTFHFNDYFVIGGIHTRLWVSDNPMFLWISFNSCPLNLLLFRSHQAEIIIVKRLIQGRNNVTRVRVEPRPFDQGRRKNDAFTHSATLSTNITVLWHTPLHATTLTPTMCL